MKTKQAGLSLIEVIIAAAILGVLVTLTMTILTSSSEAATRASINSDLEARGNQFMAFSKEELISAQFTGSITCNGVTFPLGIPAASGGTALLYRVPGTISEDGTALTGGTIAYGYFSPVKGFTGFRANLACALRFEPETVFKESHAAPDPTAMTEWGSPFPDYPARSTVVLDMDVNRDNDRTDTYVRGKIKRYILAPDASKVLASNSGAWILASGGESDHVILRVNPSNTQLYNGNVDGNATSPQSELDPLFLFVGQDGPNGTAIDASNIVTDGKALIVTVWHGTLGYMNKQFVLRRSQQTLKFRNTQ